MIKVQCLFCVWVATLHVVFGVGDMGEGRWRIIGVGECDEPEQYKCKIYAERRKHNRTMDVFDASIECDEDIDDNFGALIEICKHVDGGCKEWQVLSDDSVPRFGKKYAEGNMQRALEMAQIDPPEFPVKAGKYEIKEFPLDYCEFPKECVYGKFTALAFLVRGGERVACVQATVEFDEDTDGYDCD